MAELVHEQVTHVRTPDGDANVPRTYGERQSDGKWDGWFEGAFARALATASRRSRYVRSIG